MRIDIEAWAPEYGAPIETDALEPSHADVDIGPEVPAQEWRPLDPPRAVVPPRSIAFVDGVRRIDARVWITHEDRTSMGICASYGAGIVVCDGSDAALGETMVRRGLFATARAPDLETRAGTYRACAVAGDDIERLAQGLQERMALLERDVAEAAMAGPAIDLLLLDGPLTGKIDLIGAVGYVKTHRVAYLPPAAAAVIPRLGPGQRSPVFLTQGSWSRFSWYLRLAPPAGHPWSAIVRCETSAGMPLAEVRDVADRTAAVLPRFASRPHKDPRAPQNLYPIAGLERELRRRLGDPGLVYRALRAGAT